MLRAALLAAVVTLLAAAPAAATPIDDAATALASDPVYQAPDAQLALSAEDLDRVRDRIRASGEPIFVVILPASAGSPNAVVVDVGRATGRRGTYAVVTGNGFRAASDSGRAGVAATESRAAFEAHRTESLTAVLLDFVDRTAEPGVQGGEDAGGGGGFPWPLLLIGGGALALGARSRRRGRARRAEQAVEVEDVRRTAQEDIGVIAEEITELDDDVEGAGAPPQAKAAYMRALDAYERASTALAGAKTTQQLRAVAEAAADGRYEMARARALLEGRPEPERRPPCFFDPRHGPSVADAAYAPPGGEEREVPVCQACAVRLADGQEPEARTEVVDGRPQPYWAARGGGYYGGAFGGFGTGLFGGLLLGSMFDSSAHAAGFGDGGGGDSGGGDLGGGDFGGGGFGGGDFGGGGGDF